MSKNIHGTCGLCGGPVTTPTLWMGVTPPTPTCEQCGAIPDAPHGPRLKMRRPLTSTKVTLGFPDDPPWPEAELTITVVADNLDRLVTDWPGVASWQDPIVDHGVDHEVKR